MNWDNSQFMFKYSFAIFNISFAPHSPLRNRIYNDIMLNKLTCGLLIGALAATASAQTFPDIQANRPYSAYVQDARGIIVRSTYGQCWRTSFWTDADAVVGCDGMLVPPVAKSIAPPFVAKPDPTPVAAAATAPVAAPTPIPVEKPAPTVEKVNLAADALFDSGKSDLKPAGKGKLDELTAKLKNTKVETIIATGHTDSAGSAALNEKLSVKRAEAVKGYLVSKGINANLIKVAGKGAKQPIASNKTAAGRIQNRRVEIEIIGSRTK
jgi:OOP family OmpA-OmpF porin